MARETVGTEANAEEEKVEVFLPKLRGERNQDVWVCVNGKGILIQRGQSVKVAPEYAEALKHSQQADDIADEYLNNLETPK